MRSYVVARWTLFWLRIGGVSRLGRLAFRLAGLFTPPYKGRAALARKTPRGYIAPSAVIHCRDLRRGAGVFIGERVTIYQDRHGGPARLGDRVHLHQDTVLELGRGGSIDIGPDTYVQPRCQLSAHAAAIQIGAGVQIGPGCGLYPYNHGTEPGTPMREQPLATRGPIVIEDDVWLGSGVVVLSGARIGRGAVVGANSVVSGVVAPGAIVAGVPARAVRSRGPAPVAEGRVDGQELG